MRKFQFGLIDTALVLAALPFWAFIFHVVWFSPGFGGISGAVRLVLPAIVLGGISAAIRYPIRHRNHAWPVAAFLAGVVCVGWIFLIAWYTSVMARFFAVLFAMGGV
jgi:phosphoglycerol transferase MdoB-like AlkP superfamily enzyme